jgi:RNA polymerase-binding transcription factor DksA
VSDPTVTIGTTRTTETEFASAAEPDGSGSSPTDDLRRLEQIEVELAGVESTLRRLDEGRYGTCEVCGAALETGAVEADPLATRCAEHSDLTG